MPRQRKWNPDDLQRKALHDFDSGQIANEYYAKVADRRIADSGVGHVLKSRTSGVWRYTHGGDIRVGFWHPQSQLFVAWPPMTADRGGQIKTCFFERDGVRYMLDQQRVAVLCAPQKVIDGCECLRRNCETSKQRGRSTR